MWFSRHQHAQKAHTSKRDRRVRPVLEGFERRELLSGLASISGIVMHDNTGNSFSPLDTPLPGVTVNLYQKGGSTPIASTTSAANGTYSFSNLNPGSYLVQEVTPSGWIRTGGLGGYTPTLATGQHVSNANFDNFQIPAEPALQNLVFTVTTPGGKTTTTTSLWGHVQQGDTVKATFSLSAPALVTLVAYTAPNSDFGTPQNLQGQVLFSHQTTANTATGAQTLTVTVPNSYFHVVLAYGPIINHLGTNANITYIDEHRRIDLARGGTQPPAPSTVTGYVYNNGAAAPIGMNGVVVAIAGLDSTGDLVVRKTVTGSNGAYTFASLPPSSAGGYTIVEVVPHGFLELGVHPGSTGIVGKPSNKTITTFLSTNTTSIDNDFFDAPAA
jgi:hypothetical protein